MRFRMDVIQKQGRSCIVSHSFQNECEAAHIIPRKICDQLGKRLNQEERWNAIKNNSNNGLFLNKCLHHTFDQCLWTFDTNDYKIGRTATKIYYQFSIIIKNHRINNQIRNHQRDALGKLNYIQIPAENLFCLLIHNYVFLKNSHNREPITDQRLLINDYEEAVRFFDRWKARQDLLNQSNQSNQSNQILAGFLDYSSITDKFKVLYQGQPWSDQQWIDRSELPEKDCSEIDEILSQRKDPDYTVRTSNKKRKIV